MELPVFFFYWKEKTMATKDPTTVDPLADEHKMIMLPQLKRYDQKIKQKIEDSSGGYITSVDDGYDIIQLDVIDGTLTADLRIDVLAKYIADITTGASLNNTGVIMLTNNEPTGFLIDPKGGISASSVNVSTNQDISNEKLVFKLNIGKGVKLDSATGALEANVDGITVGINGNTGMISVRPTEEIAVTNQPTSGSVTAQYNPGTVCIHFNDTLVTGNSKTLVGKIPSVYAPSTAVAGVVLNPGSSWIMSAYSKVEPDGSIYVNPIYSNAAGLGWTGTLTYLI